MPRDLTKRKLRLLLLDAEDDARYISDKLDAAKNPVYARMANWDHLIRKADSIMGLMQEAMRRLEP